MPSLKSDKCREQRRNLIEEMGGRCAKCSRTANLELDCIVPQGSRHHALSFCDRTRFYVREFERGNLQVLCRDCHGFKSMKEAAEANSNVANNQAAGTLQPVPLAATRGPEPSASDWKAWCRWHQGLPPE